MDVFDLATRLEALLALKRISEAERAAADYVAHPDADSFEIGSTLRQLEEVWRLTIEEPPGATIIPLLRAARLCRQGGALETPPASVSRELAAVTEATLRLEKTLGEDRTVTLRWYKKGLERSGSVARVDRLNGEGHGTGWLVRAGDFFSSDVCPDGDRLLLLTNAHVVKLQQQGKIGAVPALSALCEGCAVRAAAVFNRTDGIRPPPPTRFRLFSSWRSATRSCSPRLPRGLLRRCCSSSGC